MRVSQRWTLGLSENGDSPNPDTYPASPSTLPFIAYQHCPSKQGKERELSIGNLWVLILWPLCTGKSGRGSGGVQKWLKPKTVPRGLSGGVAKCWYDIWTPPRYVLRCCETGHPLLATPEVCREVVRNGTPPFSTAPRSVWRGSQKTNSLLATPEVHPCDTPKMGLTQIRRIPEVHPCDTPKMGNPQKWSNPRSILQVPENPELGKTGRGPEDDREMSQRHLAVPEDDLKPHWV